jgi:hypothetical protein
MKHVVDYQKTKAKTFELIAGVWTLALYLSLGIIPMLIQ